MFTSRQRVVGHMPRARALLTTAIVATLTLLIGVMFAASADAGGGGGYGGGDGDDTEYSCPDGYELDGRWCTLTITEVFDADEAIEYVCPDGYDGPDAANQCTLETVETFPATPITELQCPDGFDGPDAAGKCTREVTVVDIVHVDESIESVCPDIGVLGIDASGDPICEIDVLVVVTAPPVVETVATCPAGYAGPDATGTCSRMTIETVPGTPSTEQLCPAGFDGPNLRGECTRTVSDTEFKGVELTTTLVCPGAYTLDGTDCVRQVAPRIEVQCPPGFDLVSDPFFGDQCIDPLNPTLPPALPIEVPVCDAPLTGPIDDGTGIQVCEDRFPALETVTVACPAGYDGPDSMNLCTRTVDVIETIPAVEVVTVLCDAGQVGPDANGDCFVITTDTVPQIEEDIESCTAPFLGPNADGDCVDVVTEVQTFDPIDVPVFTCPAGYDGPDAAWNCSKTTTTTEMVDAEEVIVDYSCPSDADGPDANNECTRTTIDVVDADQIVTYSCPSDSVGPDANNQCTRSREYKIKASHYCKIRFYDFPNANGILLREDTAGEYDLSGSLSHKNDDIESVKVPWGCNVSVAEDFGGGGWCLTLGPGIHNLPDDEMSWFSLPGTGCDNS